MKKKENFFKNNRLNSAREKYLEDRFDLKDYQLSKKEHKKNSMHYKWICRIKSYPLNSTIKTKRNQVPKKLSNLSQLYIKGEDGTRKQ